MKTYSIVCLSHLIWERNLFQRPQQLMTQFDALDHRIQYLSLMGFKRWFSSQPDEQQIRFGKAGRADNLPYVPLQKYMPFLAYLNDFRFRKIVGKLHHSTPGSTRVLWIQHPGYRRMIPKIPHDLLVYDCMDPFRAFRFSSQEILDDEDEVLLKADVVFTGGRSLHSLIEGKNPNMHCLPSGIDFPHFAQAAEPGPIPEDLAALKKPVLGYFGAVDERIDWQLIRTLCQAHREWSIVFLGPLIKMTRCPIEEPNFHYLGGKKYDLLPHYLRGFDVALIPWLVNDLTRYMSPTKTPEYLAGGRPVVSVPIPDVVADYASDVLIADSAEEYVRCCEEALKRGVGPAVKPPQSRTWREIAETMVEQINSVETTKGKLKGK